MLTVRIIQRLHKTSRHGPQQTFNSKSYGWRDQASPPLGHIVLGLNGPLPVELAQALELLARPLERPYGVDGEPAPLTEGHLGQHAAGLVVGVPLLHVGEVLGQRALVRLGGRAPPA